MFIKRGERVERVSKRNKKVVTLLVRKIASLAYLAALLGLSLGMCESAYLRKKKLDIKVYVLCLLSHITSCGFPKFLLKSTSLLLLPLLFSL
jgi:hypothetical protein